MNIHIPLFNKHLYIENGFRYENEIISLGCDCQPAYLLDTLHLRKQSLPFDWLRTKPIEGLKFATINFQNKFKFFLADLKINGRGQVISEHYPDSEFLHDNDLIINNFTRQKYERRISRILNLIGHAEIRYLYNIPISDLLETKPATYFLNSIGEFSAQMKINDTLHIYFCCETIGPKEQEIFNYFLEKTTSMLKVIISLYLRESKIHGIWGDESGYKELLATLGINIKKKVFPEIFLSNY